MKNNPGDVLAGELTPEKGTSDVGISIRRADVRNKGVTSHGYGRVSSPETHKEQAKSHLKSIISALKSQPKPNLPKSEPQEPNLQKDDLATKLKAKSLGSPFGEGAINRINRNVGSEHYSQQVKQQAQIKASMPRPKPVAPRASPPVEPGPKKVFDPAKSGKVDYFKKDQKEKPKAVPAIVSEPIVIGRGTTTKPKIIDQPNQISIYKDIIKSLHKSSMAKSEAKYINVHQDWATHKLNPKTGQRTHPLFDKGQKKLEHIDDVKHIEHFLGRKLHAEHAEPKKQSGHETYRVHPGGKLEFIHADYDTKGT